MTEFFLKSDLATLRNTLANKPVRHLFVDAPTLAAYSLGDTVHTYYRLVGASPDGNLYYLEPRTPRRLR